MYRELHGSHNPVQACTEQLAGLQNYVRLLINFKRSVVGNLQHFDEMEAALSRGENVVVLANHQTEADPGDHAYAINLSCL